MRWLVVAVAAIVGCGDDGPEAPAAPPPAPVAEIDRQEAVETEERGWIGVVAARDATDVSAKVAGVITDVHVRIGDEVTLGDPIATIDSRQLSEDISVAQAALRSARAAVSQALVEVDAARQALEIEDEAHRKGSSSLRDLTDARFRHRKALAALARARAEQAEQGAQVTDLRQRRSQTVIRAPFTGTIALRNLDPGASVQAGSPIVRLITSGELWVKFAVPGPAASRLAVGEAVTVRFEALESTGRATIRQISPELEPNSQMIIVEAELATAGDLPDRVQAGLVVRVTR